MRETRVRFPVEALIFSDPVTFGTQSDLRAWNTWGHVFSLEGWMWQRCLGGLEVKTLARNAGDRGSVPRWGTDFFGPCDIHKMPATTYAAHFSAFQITDISLCQTQTHLLHLISTHGKVLTIHGSSLFWCTCKV